MAKNKSLKSLASVRLLAEPWHNIDLFTRFLTTTTPTTTTISACHSW